MKISFDYKNKNLNNIEKIYIHILEKLNLSNVVNNDPTKNINIPVHFIKKKEEMANKFEDDNNCSIPYGFCTIKNNEETEYTQTPEIYLLVDEKYLKNKMFISENIMSKGEKAYEIGAILTHEISHAIEYIECSKGLSPKKIYEMNKKGNFPLTPEECLTGYLQYYNNKNLSFIEQKDQNLLINLMEKRVEEKGRTLLNEYFNELDIVFLHSCINNLDKNKKKLKSKK